MHVISLGALLTDSTVLPVSRNISKATETFFVEFVESTVTLNIRANPKLPVLRCRSGRWMGCAECLFLKLFVSKSFTAGVDW